MDLQFYGANCLSLTYKGVRIVVDDNLVALGGRSITKADDISLFTNAESQNVGRLVITSPGEYEILDISIVGIAAQAHTDEAGTSKATIYKLMAGDTSVLVTGHIYPELSEAQLEIIGLVDVMVVPVGGNGYTVDPGGVLKLIKEVEPKIVVPTHYSDKTLKFPVPQQDLNIAVRELAMEPRETVAKVRIKPSELSDLTQLIILEKQ